MGDWQRWQEKPGLAQPTTICHTLCHEQESCFARFGYCRGMGIACNHACAGRRLGRLDCRRWAGAPARNADRDGQRSSPDQREEGRGRLRLPQRYKPGCDDGGGVPDSAVYKRDRRSRVLSAIVFRLSVGNRGQNCAVYDGGEGNLERQGCNSFASRKSHRYSNLWPFRRHGKLKARRGDGFARLFPASTNHKRPTGKGRYLRTRLRSGRPVDRASAIPLDANLPSPFHGSHPA